MRLDDFNVSSIKTANPAPTLFYVVKEKKTVTVHLWSLHLGFGARDPFYPGQVFSI